jgi:hypothetical protein
VPEPPYHSSFSTHANNAVPPPSSSSQTPPPSLTPSHTANDSLSITINFATCTIRVKTNVTNSKEYSIIRAL